MNSASEAFVGGATLGRVALAAIASLALVHAPVAHADDGWLLVPRATLGYLDYELDFGEVTFDGFPVGDATFEVSSPLVGIGATAVTGRFYVDMYGQFSVPPDSLESRPLPGSSLAAQEFEATRSDFSIAIGYQFNQYLSAYAGVRYGHGKAKAEDSSDRAEIEEYGPFAGVALSYPIGSGVLSLNAAAALLRGTFESEDRVEFFDLTARVTGFTYGVAYSGRITDRLGYTLALDAQEFEFDNISNSGRAATDSADETMYLLRASLRYAIDL